MVSNYFTVFSVPTLLFWSSVFQAGELEHGGSADGNAFVPCSSLFFFDPFPVLLHACRGGEEQSLHSAQNRSCLGLYNSTVICFVQGDICFSSG